MIDENAKFSQINKINKYDEVKSVITDLLGRLTVEFDDIQVEDRSGHPIILIKTNDSGILIGNNGESLRAFNHIVKRIVEKKFSEDKLQFLLDVNDYHGKRINALKNQAKILADRARMFKSDVEMDPINSYERMVIHSLFTDDAEIKTESKGEGKTRRLVFKYIKSNPHSTDDL